MAKEKATGAGSPARLGREARQAARVLAHGPGGGGGPFHCRFPAAARPGDILIDGGNSYYVDDIRRGTELAAKGIHYVDVGTSGGVWGLERDHCMMIGGEPEVVQRLDPIFARSLPAWETFRAPRAGRIPRHLRTGLSALRPEPGRALRENGSQWSRIRHLGCLRRGIGGASKAARLQTKRRAPTWKRSAIALIRSAINTTSPWPKCFRWRWWRWKRHRLRLFWIDLQHRTVLWLSQFAQICCSCLVFNSGEGRWTIKAAIDEGVPVPVLTTAALRAVHLPGRGGLSGQIAFRHALWLRWASGKNKPLRINEHKPIRCSRILRRHGRPGVTRRSSPRCRRWSNAAISMSR